MGNDGCVALVSSASRGIGLGVTLERRDGHCRLQIAEPYEVQVPSSGFLKDKELMGASMPHPWSSTI